MWAKVPGGAYSSQNWAKFAHEFYNGFEVLDLALNLSLQYSCLLEGTSADNPLFVWSMRMADTQIPKLCLAGYALECNLKAILTITKAEDFKTAKDGVPRWMKGRDGHDLVKLSNLCGLKFEPPVNSFLRNLTLISVSGRYPEKVTNSQSSPYIYVDGKPIKMNPFYRPALLESSGYKDLFRKLFWDLVSHREQCEGKKV